MYLSKTICAVSATLLLSLPFTLAQANWTAMDGSGINAASGTFVLQLNNYNDPGSGVSSLTVWTETTPTAQTTTIACNSSIPWQAFKNNDLPYPIGLHYSAKWCGGSNSDGLWLNYYDLFQTDVSTSGYCEHFYPTSKLSWICYFLENPDNRKYGC